MANLSKMSKGDRVEVRLEEGDELFLTFDLPYNIDRERSYVLKIFKSPRYHGLVMSKIEGDISPKEILKEDKEFSLFNERGFASYPKSKVGDKK